MTSRKTQMDINHFIEKEMRALAGEYFDELWEEIEEANLDVGVIAEVLIERILAKVAAQKGEAVASELVAHIKQLDQMGTLTGPRVLQ
ncbi:MAG: hypothetical protein AAFN43_04625 [Pseudomonadota bacterium]